MTKPLVLWESGDIAQPHITTSQEIRRGRRATVDRDYASVSEFCGPPLVAFDGVAQRFPGRSPTRCSWRWPTPKLNGVRKENILPPGLGHELASYSPTLPS